MAAAAVVLAASSVAADANINAATGATDLLSQQQPRLDRQTFCFTFVVNTTAPAAHSIAA